MSRVTFYFDLGSPFAYLASERVDELLGESVRWQGVSLGALFKLNGRSSWALGTPQQRSAGMADVERRARDYGLAPVRWPEPWPGHYLMAMRATIFAFGSDRGRQFVRHAYALAFQQGRDLSLPATVLWAANEAGLDPREVEAATGDPQIKSALREATQQAHELGVFGVPTVAIGEELFWGDDRLEEAARRSAANLG
ncbi:MAG TPA: 2-hydroxychromene-2-carboxylate isomerase [Solirubrobacteraceae bacterium]